MNRSYQTPQPITARVRVPAGEIGIETTDAAETAVDVEPTNDAATELVERVRVELEGNELTVEVPEHRVFRPGAEFDVRVRCPSGSTLMVRAASADVSLQGRYAGVEVKTASGDVRVGDVEGETSIATASGDVELVTSRGPAAVSTASGDVRVERASGGLKASLVSGDLDVQEIDGGADVRTTSGDVTLEGIGVGAVRASTVSGDVSARVCSGLDVWMDVSSLSGDLRSELESTEAPTAERDRLVELRINTVSGDVSIGRAG